MDIHSPLLIKYTDLSLAPDFELTSSERGGFAEPQISYVPTEEVLPFSGFSCVVAQTTFIQDVTAVADVDVVKEDTVSLIQSLYVVPFSSDPVVRHQYEQYETPFGAAETMVKLYDSILLGNDQLGLKHQTVVDIGVGGGSLSIALLRAGTWHVVGIELDPHIYEVLVEKWTELQLDATVAANRPVTLPFTIAQGDVHLAKSLVKRFAISNPPFGLYQQSLVQFVKSAFNLAHTVMYVVRTREVHRLISAGITDRFQVVPIQQLNIDLPNTLPNHTLQNYTVDCTVLVAQTYPAQLKFPQRLLPKKMYYDIEAQTVTVSAADMRDYALAWRERQSLRDMIPTSDFYCLKNEKVGSNYHIEFLLGRPVGDTSVSRYLQKTLKYNGVLLDRMRSHTEFSTEDLRDAEALRAGIKSLLENTADHLSRNHWIRVKSANSPTGVVTGIFKAVHTSVYNKDGVNVKFTGDITKEINIYSDLQQQVPHLLSKTTLGIHNNAPAIFRHGISYYTFQDVVDAITDQNYKVVTQVMSEAGFATNLTCDSPNWWHCVSCQRYLVKLAQYFLHIWLVSNEFVNTVKGYKYILTPDNIEAHGTILDFGDYDVSQMSPKEKLTSIIPIRESIQSVWVLCGMPWLFSPAVHPDIVTYIDGVFDSKHSHSLQTWLSVLQSNYGSESVETFGGGIYIRKYGSVAVSCQADFKGLLIKILADLDVLVGELAGRRVDYLLPTTSLSNEWNKAMAFAHNFVMSAMVKRSVTFEKYKRYFLVDEYGGFTVERGVWDKLLKQGNLSPNFNQRMVYSMASNYRYDVRQDMWGFGFDWSESVVDHGVLVPKNMCYPLVGNIPIETILSCNHPECKRSPGDQKLFVFASMAHLMWNSISKFPAVHQTDLNNLKCAGSIAPGTFKVAAPGPHGVEVDYVFIDWLYQNGQGVSYVHNDSLTGVEYIWELTQRYWRSDVDGIREDLDLFGKMEGGSVTDSLIILGYSMLLATMRDEISKAITRGAVEPKFRWSHEQAKVLHGKSAGTPLNLCGWDALQVDRCTSGVHDAVIMHASRTGLKTPTQANVKIQATAKSRVRTIAGVHPYTNIMGRAVFQNLRETMMKGDIFKIGIGIFYGMWNEMLKWHFSFQHDVRKAAPNGIPPNTQYRSGGWDFEKWDRKLNPLLMLIVHLVAVELLEVGPSNSREHYNTTEQSDDPTYEEACYRDYGEEFPNLSPAEIARGCIWNLTVNEFVSITFNTLKSGALIYEKPSGISSGGSHTADGNGYNHLLLVCLVWLDWVSSFNMPGSPLLDEAREIVMEHRTKPFCDYDQIDLLIIGDKLRLAKELESEKVSILSDDNFRLYRLDYSFPEEFLTKAAYKLSGFVFTPDKYFCLNGVYPPLEFCSQATVVDEALLFHPCPNPTKVMNSCVLAGVLNENQNYGNKIAPAMKLVRFSALAALAIPVKWRPNLPTQQHELANTLITYIKSTYPDLSVTTEEMELAAGYIPVGGGVMASCVEEKTNKLVDYEWLSALYKPSNGYNAATIVNDFLKAFKASQTLVSKPSVGDPPPSADDCVVSESDLAPTADIDTEYVGVSTTANLRRCDYGCSCVAKYMCDACSYYGIGCCAKHAFNHMEDEQHYSYSYGKFPLACFDCGERDIRVLYSCNNITCCSAHITTQPAYPYVLDGKFIGDTDSNIMSSVNLPAFKEYIHVLATTGHENDVARRFHYQLVRQNISLHMRITQLDVQVALTKVKQLMPFKISEVKESCGVYVIRFENVERKSALSKTYKLSRKNWYMCDIKLNYLDDGSFQVNFVDKTSDIKVGDVVTPDMITGPLLRAQQVMSTTMRNQGLLDLLWGSVRYNQPPDIPDPGLNYSQMEAFRTVFSQNLTFIQGPPGTGKTFVAVKILLAAIEMGWTVVVASSTHNAVDNIINRLYAKHRSGVFRNVPTEHADRVKCDAPAYLHGFLRVLGTTLTTNLPGVTRSVDMLLVDESSKCEDSHLYSTILACSPARVVFLGDHMQLPPVSPYSAPVANIVNYHCLSGHQRVVMLRDQFRMCQQISDYVSDTFYKGLLTCQVGPVPDYLGPTRLVSVSVPGHATSVACTQTQTHAGEVRSAQLIINHILPYCSGKSIAAICMYDGTHSSLKPLVESVFVGTVDSTQGKEYNVVLVLVTSLRSAFSVNPNRINVAISRAKDYCIILSSDQLVPPYPVKAPHYDLISFMQELEVVCPSAVVGVPDSIDSEALTEVFDSKYIPYIHLAADQYTLALSSGVFLEPEQTANVLKRDIISIDFEGVSAVKGFRVGGVIKGMTYPVQLGYKTAKQVVSIYCQPTNLYYKPDGRYGEEPVPDKLVSWQRGLHTTRPTMVAAVRKTGRTMLAMYSHFVAQLRSVVLTKVVFLTWAAKMEYTSLHPTIIYTEKEERCATCSCLAPFFDSERGPVCSNCEVVGTLKILNPCFIDMQTLYPGRRLTDVCAEQFGQVPENAHNASVDASMVWQLYNKFRKQLSPAVSLTSRQITASARGRVELHRRVQRDLVEFMANTFTSVIDIGVGSCKGVPSKLPHRFDGVDPVLVPGLRAGSRYDNLFTCKYEELNDTYDAFLSIHSIYHVAALKEPVGYVLCHVLDDVEAVNRYTDDVDDARVQVVGFNSVYTHTLLTHDQLKLKFPDYEIEYLQNLPHNCNPSQDTYTVDVLSVVPNMQCLTAAPIDTTDFYVIGDKSCIHTFKTQLKYQNQKGYFPVRLYKFTRKLAVTNEALGIQTFEGDTDNGISLDNVCLPGYETRTKRFTYDSGDLRMARTSSKIYSIIYTFARNHAFKVGASYLILGSSSGSGQSPMYYSMSNLVKGRYTLVDPRQDPARKVGTNDIIIREVLEDALPSLQTYELIVSDVYAVNVGSFWDALLELVERQDQNVKVAIKFTSKFNNFEVLQAIANRFKHAIVGRVPCAGISTEAWLCCWGHGQKPAAHVNVLYSYKALVRHLQASEQFVLPVKQSDMKNLKSLLNFRTLSLGTETLVSGAGAQSAVILFRLSDPHHSWLSNLFPVNITVDGKIYPSVEHYYQTQKCVANGYSLPFTDANTPTEVMFLTKELFHNKFYPKWVNSKEHFMRKALLAKFTTEPFMSQLYKTLGYELRENTQDPLWGGKNNLCGRLIMEVRDTIFGASN